MLSLILKPLLKNSNQTLEDINLPPDTEISLSLIESGCIFVSLNKKAALIIKSSLDEIKLLKNINRITLNFELIERPEFPSLGMHLEINTVSNASFKFEYFFSTESMEEIDLLNKLKDQNYFDILFFNTQIEYSKTIELTEEEKSELNSLINKATK
ncbi:MAG: hypothetical protein E2O72_07710 [Candidatus Dadabacteria bacterium]|nr:MAG: hypothetical protein E2O72_07710 [Candidatus Dadabacteria bacterium]TDJ02981.1 MAG: hypothetical protein E2O70_00765 [Candidatus Dadabacteria bacterium]